MNTKRDKLVPEIPDVNFDIQMQESFSLTILTIKV